MDAHLRISWFLVARLHLNILHDQVLGHPPNEQRLDAGVEEDHVEFPFAVDLHSVDLRLRRTIQ